MAEVNWFYASFVYKRMRKRVERKKNKEIETYGLIVGDESKYSDRLDRDAKVSYWMWLVGGLLLLYFIYRIYMGGLI